MTRIACLFRSFVLLLAFSSMQAGAAHADIPGSQDHPLVGRYDGSEIVGYTVTDYDEVKVVDGPFDGATAETQAGEGFKTLEGRAILIYYKLPQGRSSLEVLRNYEASLKARGGSVLFTCATSDGSCFTRKEPDAAYFLGSAIGPALSLPKLDDDYVHNWFEQKGRYLLARLNAPHGTVYASLFLGESARGNVAVLRVVETKAMDTDKIVFIDAGQMEKALDEAGKVSLYGIQFDFDKDTLRPEAQPTLDEIAKLMEAKPSLRLQIVGHTDNQGTAAYNLDLSSRRANRVVEALAQTHGIAAARLSARGAGLAEPIAPNDSEEGRAKNRRVELIAQ
jgi:outer membrane protein OmpA-like peptidoglycan-associated protein